MTFHYLLPFPIIVYHFRFLFQGMAIELNMGFPLFSAQQHSAFL
jgi:hypothetical protein